MRLPSDSFLATMKNMFGASRTCFISCITIHRRRVEPVTKITVGPGAQVDLLVTRNAFAAKAHPKQTVKVVVEENLSTANPGGDFILSEQAFNFKNKDALQLPLRVNISGGTSGKKIVLCLDYGYYDECSPESRKGDKLIIKVK